jgi:hypothetical protein
MNKTAKSGGEACVQLADGSYSADALHEQMTAGVDDSAFQAETRAKLLAKGIPPSALNSGFPDLEPLPVDLNEERERAYRTKVRAEMRDEFGVSAKDLNRRFPDLEPLPED